MMKYWMKKLLQLHRGKRGQTIIITTFSIMLILGMALGFLQFAEVRYVQQQTQAALDAACLAGASEQVSVIMGYTPTGQYKWVKVSSTKYLQKQITTPVVRQQIWMNAPSQSNQSGTPLPHLVVGTTQARAAFFSILNQNDVQNFQGVSLSGSHAIRVQFQTSPPPPTTQATTVKNMIVPYQTISGTATIPVRADLLSMAEHIINGKSPNPYLVVSVSSKASLVTK